MGTGRCYTCEPAHYSRGVLVVPQRCEAGFLSSSDDGHAVLLTANKAWVMSHLTETQPVSQESNRPKCSRELQKELEREREAWEDEVTLQGGEHSTDLNFAACWISSRNRNNLWDFSFLLTAGQLLVSLCHFPWITRFLPTHPHLSFISNLAASINCLREGHIYILDIKLILTIERKYTLLYSYSISE